MKKSKSKASSSAAAELLATGSSTTTGFGSSSGFGSGFGSAFASTFGASTANDTDPPTPAALSRSTSTASSTTSSSSIDWASFMYQRSHEIGPNDVTDPGIILAFKQLAKRDPITRLKALESLQTAFHSMSSSQALATLPTWLVAQHDRLHLDSDRRVREAIWQCFSILRTKAGKQFATYLKTALPMWWTHQSDPCKEVAKAAQKEWQTAFPVKLKQQQALLYGHREYFAYCQSLFAHTPQTLSDQTVYSPEESAERWERGTASTIASIAEFIEATTATTDSGSESASTSTTSTQTVSVDEYNTLLPASVLLKFVRCKTVHIRRASYGLLKSLITHDPAGFVTNNLSSLAPVILCELLDEMDRTNHQAMLDCVLSFLRKHSTAAWELLQRQPATITGFYARLKKLLQTGLGGNYCAVYPCVLPLLSLIPDSVMQLASGNSLESFYSFFFTNLWSGRTTLHDAGGGALSLQGQSKELLALFDCYFECLVWSVKKRRGNQPLQKLLVSQHLLAEVVAPALHFVSPHISPTTDPSVTADAVVHNRFGPALFERVGRCFRDSLALMDVETDVEQAWTQMSRSCVDALERSVHVTEEDSSSSVPATPTSATTPQRRTHHQISSIVQPIDEYLAVGLILSQQTRAVADGELARPLITTVASVFHLALAHFTEQPFRKLSALKLTVQLADSFSIKKILAASTSNLTLNAFLSASLLPVLRVLLTHAANVTDQDAGAATLHSSYIETVEIFSRGLLSRTLDELGLSNKKSDSASTDTSSSTSSSTSSTIDVRVWEELLTLLSSSSISATSSIAASKLHLALLRIMFTFIFAKCPSVHGHAALQDLVVTQAEQFLTCEKAELLPEYVGIFQSIIATPGLLAKGVLSALVSSFLDAVESFQRAEDDLMMATRPPEQSSNSPAFVRQFEADTGCTIQALPSLITLLGSLLTGNTLVQVSPTTVEADKMRAQITKATFWLQHSPRESVAVEAGRVWDQKIDRAELKENPSVLFDLASVFRSRIFTSPLSSFTSQFIVSWSSWLTQLFATIAHPYIQQKILDAALPTHKELKELMAGSTNGTVSLHDIAERLRVIRDLISELQFAPGSVVINERVLFLGESATAAIPLTSTAPVSGLQWEGQPRLNLLVDLIAIQQFLAAFEKEPDLRVLQSPIDSIQLKIHNQEESHVAILDRLPHFLATSMVSGSHLTAMIKFALAESQATIKDMSAATAETIERATDSSRAYTAALNGLLRFAHSNLFSQPSAQTTANSIRTLLSSFLNSIKVDQIRTHSHVTLYQPFEDTLVTVLESGCVRVFNDSTIEPSISNLMKWTQEGYDAGTRLLAKQNDRLFGLSSLLRIQAALIRSFEAAPTTPTTTVLEIFTAFRSRIITSVASLNLFEPLANGVVGFSLPASRFYEARSSLLEALVASAGFTLDGTFIQTAILWSVAVLKYAGNQHTAAIRVGMETQKTSTSSSSASSISFTALSPVPSSSWYFNYLTATIHLMSSLIPIVLPTTPSELSSQPGIASAVHSFVSICYPLLVASKVDSPFYGILSAMSVKYFTAASMDLERIIRTYRDVRPLKLVEIVREDLRRVNENDSSAVRSLFLLLAHPIPSFALCALHLLSVGLLDRAICVPINFEVDETQEMAHVLAAIAELQKNESKKDKKKRLAAQAAANGEETADSEQQELEMEHYRKTIKNDYQKQLTQKRLDELLPLTLQRILEERCQTNDIDIIELAEPRTEIPEDIPFFSHRPVALQLRGQLLTWSLVLDVLSQTLPAPDGVGSSSKSSAAVNLSLSDEKSSLFLSYLRESDAITPFASELIEHILVSLPESSVERFILRTVKNYEHRSVELEEKSEESKEEVKYEPSVVVEEEDEDGNIITPPKSAAPTDVELKTVAAPPIREFPLWHTPAILTPTEPIPDLKVLTFSMRRLLRIRKSVESGVHVDSNIYFGYLGCLLYLRTLRVLPGLSRSWFTTIDRSNGTIINKLTSSSFSPLLIQDELLNVTQHQAQSATVDDDEEQFIISTNYAPEQFVRKNVSAGSSPAMVYARFIRGEISMGLSIKLPSCYPLLPSQVALTDQVKLKESLSKKWLLGITSILSSSDGSMYHAIRLWKKNLDQHFSGVSECTICYSVISSVNHSLPTMKCNECNNKFHSTCLYKWFASSGNSKCPLCRSLFSA